MKFKVGDRVGLLGSSRTGTVIVIYPNTIIVRDDKEDFEQEIRSSSPFLTKISGGKRRATKRKRSYASRSTLGRAKKRRYR